MILVRNNAGTLAELLAYRVADDPLRLLAIFNVAYTVIISLSVACGILGLVAAVTLPRRGPLGRKVALLAGFLSLSRIPLGITLGVYTLVVLLPTDGLSSDTSSADNSD
ncbi:MAG TPA: hypothetical protein VGZ29_11840 [Terriglobia bacterium]|nr:hypothetical protein [Terriglobia bacterium]